MANPHPFATVNHIRLALRIPHVSHLHGDLVLVIKVISDQDSQSMLFDTLRITGLDYGQRYFFTIAVHGEHAKSRRIDLMIDVVSEKEVVIMEAPPEHRQTADI
jgi:hypothetical protein